MIRKQFFTTYKFNGNVTSTTNMDFMLSYYFGLIFDPKTRTIWHKSLPYGPTYALDTNSSGSSNNTYNEIHNDYDLSVIDGHTTYSSVFGHNNKLFVPNSSQTNFNGVGNTIFGANNTLFNTFTTNGSMVIGSDNKVEVSYDGSFIMGYRANTSKINNVLSYIFAIGDGTSSNNHNMIGIINNGYVNFSYTTKVYLENSTPTTVRNNYQSTYNHEYGFVYRTAASPIVYNDWFHSYSQLENYVQNTKNPLKYNGQIISVGDTTINTFNFKTQGIPDDYANQMPLRYEFQYWFNMNLTNKIPNDGVYVIKNGKQVRLLDIYNYNQIMSDMAKLKTWTDVALESVFSLSHEYLSYIAESNSLYDDRFATTQKYTKGTLIDLRYIYESALLQGKQINNITITIV